jgi:ParB family chromosome partitioning protein
MRGYVGSVPPEYRAVAARQNAAQVLRDATTAYKVDVDAISLKVKQEFAAKEKAKLAPKPAAKAVPPKARKAA